MRIVLCHQVFILACVSLRRVDVGTSWAFVIGGAVEIFSMLDISRLHIKHDRK